MILEIILALALIASIAAIALKDLLQAVIVLAAADAAIALVFFMLGAPDIAVTQIAVTGGLTTMIFLLVIGKTRRLEK